MKLDTVYLVETPEGIDLQAELAGLIPRALAYTIDFLIRFTVLFILMIVLGMIGAGKAGTGIGLIAFFLLEWIYPVVFEVYRDGQTIGKKKLAIKVVNEDLTPVKLGASLTRNLLRAADFLPFAYMFGIISILLNGKFQRLGDLSAGTIVVYHEKTENTSIDTMDSVQPIAPTVDLDEAKQAAFINFTLNRGNISEARRAEIADIIKPMIPKGHPDPVKYIKGVGKWLLGIK